MKPHNIVVNRYKASPDNLELGTYGSYGNETLKFCFKDGWDDTTSAIAVFNSNLDNPTSVLVESDGICKVPHEATDFVTKDGRITLVGYKDNAKIISLDLSFVVYNHSAVDGEIPQDPTPDVFQQYLQNVKNIIDKAVPPDGQTGYVLTKTDEGSAWMEPELQSDSILSVDENGVMFLSISNNLS